MPATYKFQIPSQSLHIPKPSVHFRGRPSGPPRHGSSRLLGLSLMRACGANHIVGLARGFAPVAECVYVAELGFLSFEPLAGPMSENALKILLSQRLLPAAIV